jgi:molybdenum cofactor guanylyltransferase
MRTAGIVLCGGRSSRMGRPKAWLPFGNEFMLQRVVRVLREVVDPVVVVAAPGQEVPALPADVRIIRDEIEGKGPLAGLAAGLAALAGTADAVYLSSCDVPFLKPEFVRRVIELGHFTTSIPKYGDEEDRGFAASVPRVGGHLHPLASAYRLSVWFVVQQLLAADRLRTGILFDSVPTRIIEAHELADIDPDFASLRNLNTPEEYEAALRELDAPGG